MTEIISNGSKWAGDELDTIDQLLEVLTETALDRTFEDFGNFIMRESDTCVHFWGNFANVSHVFSIRTDDADTVTKLTAAILANQKRPDYVSQHKPKPFAETQREMSARIIQARRGARR